MNIKSCSQIQMLYSENRENFDILWIKFSEIMENLEKNIFENK